MNEDKINSKVRNQSEQPQIYSSEFPVESCQIVLPTGLQMSMQSSTIRADSLAEIILESLDCITKQNRAKKTPNYYG